MNKGIVSRIEQMEEIKKDQMGLGDASNAGLADEDFVMDAA